MSSDFLSNIESKRENGELKPYVFSRPIIFFSKQFYFLVLPPKAEIFLPILPIIDHR